MDRLSVFREDDATKKLFEDFNGTSVISSCIHFWKEASGLCGQSGLACFCGVLEEFDVSYSVLFSSNPKEKSSTVMLWCSCRPRRPKYWVRSHQTVWTKTCAHAFPSFFFSHSSFSSVVVRLLALFGRLPLPCCRSRGAFPSRTCFELLNSLSPIIECLYSFSVRYRLL